MTNETPLHAPPPPPPFSPMQAPSPKESQFERLSLNLHKFEYNNTPNMCCRKASSVWFQPPMRMPRNGGNIGILEIGGVIGVRKPDRCAFQTAPPLFKRMAEEHMLYDRPTRCPSIGHPLLYIAVVAFRDQGAQKHHAHGGRNSRSAAPHGGLRWLDHNTNFSSRNFRPLSTDGPVIIPYKYSTSPTGSYKQQIIRVDEVGRLRLRVVVDVECHAVARKSETLAGKCPPYTLGAATRSTHRPRRDRERCSRASVLPQTLAHWLISARRTCTCPRCRTKRGRECVADNATRAPTVHLCGRASKAPAMAAFERPTGLPPLDRALGKQRGGDTGPAPVHEPLRQEVAELQSGRVLDQCRPHSEGAHGGVSPPTPWNYSWG